jgi:hypothetical protein
VGLEPVDFVQILDAKDGNTIEFVAMRIPYG